MLQDIKQGEHGNTYQVKYILNLNWTLEKKSVLKLVVISAMSTSEETEKKKKKKRDPNKC